MKRQKTLLKGARNQQLAMNKRPPIKLKFYHQKKLEARRQL